jgi:hypothetical protein
MVEVDNRANAHSARAATSTPLDEAQRVRRIYCLIAAATVSLTFMVLANSVLKDPDNLWHVKVGLDLIANRSLPTADTYSYTFAGHPWMAKEWLSQIIFALAYKATGWNGVALATIAAIGLTAFLFARYVSAELRPTVALGLTVVTALFISPTFNARPFIFSFPIMLIWTAQLFHAAREGRAPPMWLLALIGLWANLHAAFTFGFVIAAFAGLDLLERIRFSNPGLLLRWVGFGLICPLVTLLNPYGFNAILATFNVAYGNEAVPYITEWHPFDASERYVHEWAILLMIFVLFRSRFQIGWARAAFIVFTLHLLLIHVRFVYLLFLLGPIVLAPEIASQYPRLSARLWATDKRDAIERFLSCHFREVCGSIAGLLGIGAALVLSLVPVAPAKNILAENAMAYAESHNLTGHVLNHYNFGGSLILHGIKTFIDGRTDQLFLNGFARRYFDMEKSNGRPIVEKALQDYDISWALLLPKDERIPHFEALPNWKRAYSDDVAVIFVRTN